MTAGEIFLAVPWLAAGVVLGRWHFHQLRRAVDGLVASQGGRGRLLPHLQRFGLTCLLLVLAALQGALPLLAAFTGFLLARHLALRAEAAG